MALATCLFEIRGVRVFGNIADESGWIGEGSEHWVRTIHRGYKYQCICLVKVFREPERTSRTTARRTDGIWIMAAGQWRRRLTPVFVGSVRSSFNWVHLILALTHINTVDLSRGYGPSGGYDL